VPAFPLPIVAIYDASAPAGMQEYGYKFENVHFCPGKYLTQMNEAKNTIDEDQLFILSDFQRAATCKEDHPVEIGPASL
jgi:hypothetical protein